MADEPDVFAPIFGRKKPDGRRYYSDEDIQSVMPILLLSIGRNERPETIEPRTAAAIARVLRNLGLGPRSSQEEYESVIYEFLDTHTYNEELLAEITRALGATIAGQALAKVTLKNKSHDRIIGEVRPANAPKLGEAAPEGVMSPEELAKLTGNKRRV